MIFLEEPCILSPGKRASKPAAWQFDSKSKQSSEQSF